MSGGLLGVAARAMVLGVVVSLLLLFAGMGALVVIHVCVVGRVFRRGLVAITRGQACAGLPPEDLDVLPCYEYNKLSGDNTDGRTGAAAAFVPYASRASRAATTAGCCPCAGTASTRSALSGCDGYREANVVCVWYVYVFQGLIGLIIWACSTPVSSACHRDNDECRVLNATEVAVVFW
ncbi:hypothetical protein Taro_047175 [Colocasia esculenta]|uniref:Uncharacterized protein n=1 Tax=Colocasia esculenta TaxID=4460 RepID=A0A843X6E7_COLES|nr:hypothetical protein [Colocasia esculenta]